MPACSENPNEWATRAPRTPRDNKHDVRHGSSSSGGVGGGGGGGGIVGGVLAVAETKMEKAGDRVCDDAGGSCSNITGNGFVNLTLQRRVRLVK
jgi:hypothetical protein